VVFSVFVGYGVMAPMVEQAIPTDGGEPKVGFPISNSNEEDTHRGASDDNPLAM
jgi:hypothetical protein